MSIFITIETNCGGLKGFRALSQIDRKSRRGSHIIDATKGCTVYFA